MKKQILIAILTAGIALALVFTLNSCSEDKDKGSSPSPDDYIEKEESMYDNPDEIIFRAADISKDNGRNAEGDENPKTYNGFVGKGYNVLGSSYWNSREVKTVYIVDPDSLAANGLISVGPYPRTDKKEVFTQSLSEYIRQWNSFGGIGEEGVFSASLEADFGKSEGFKKEHIFGKSMAYIEKERHYINEWSYPILRKYARKRFWDEYLMNNNVSPDDLFKEYGTHMIKDMYMGGRFEMTFLVDNSPAEFSFNDIISIAKDLAPAVAKLAAKVEINAANDNADKIKQMLRENGNSRVRTFGGTVSSAGLDVESAKSSYASWSASIDTKDRLELVSAPGIIPIWELIDVSTNNPNYAANYARRKKIEDRYKELLASQGSKIAKAQSDKPSKLYVKNIYMGSDERVFNYAEAVINSKAKDAVILWDDLNAGNTGHVVLIGYTTTTNPNDAVTDIKGQIVCCQSAYGDPYVKLDTDCNKGANWACAKDIWLHQSKLTPAQGGKQPITNLYVQNKYKPSAPSGSHWTKVPTNLNTTTLACDWPEVYLWVERNPN
jgi:hypothetical protein